MPNSELPDRGNQRWQGILLMNLSNLLYILMAVAIKLAPSVSPVVMAFFRFVIGMGVVVSLAMVGRTLLKFHDYKGLFWRGLVGGLSVVLFYLPINSIGLGKTSLFQYMYPFWAIVFGIFILKEKPTGRVWALLALAVAGLVLLNWDSLLTGQWNWMVVAAWASGVLSGLAVAWVKKLTATETSAAIFLAQSIGGFWLFLIPGGLALTPLDGVAVALVVATGLLAAAGQLTMTMAYRKLDVATGSLLGTLIPVINVLVGVLVFGEVFGPVEAVGAVVVLAACFLLIVAKNQTKV